MEQSLPLCGKRQQTDMYGPRMGHSIWDHDSLFQHHVGSALPIGHPVSVHGSLLEKERTIYDSSATSSGSGIVGAGIGSTNLQQLQPVVLDQSELGSL